jgi:hypothetical protein
MTPEEEIDNDKKVT